MFTYILRRLLLLPLTLFFILLINFIIINLAPGDPVSYVEISGDGASLQANRSLDTKNNERYLQFREFYGLTLPILFNTWPFLSKSEIKASLSALISRKWPAKQQEMSAKEYQQLLTTTVGLTTRALEYSQGARTGKIRARIGYAKYLTRR